MYQVTDDELLMIYKVLFAAILGLLIGIERKGGEKGAGPRTFTLICMSAALLTSLSFVSFSDDSARFAAAIISGIGFIGAGIIWRSKGEVVHGVTTAAAVWVTSAVGITVGSGNYLLAMITTAMIMIILAKGHPVKVAKRNIIVHETKMERGLIHMDDHKKE